MDMHLGFILIVELRKNFDDMTGAELSCCLSKFLENGLTTNMVCYKTRIFIQNYRMTKICNKTVKLVITVCQSIRGRSCKSLTSCITLRFEISQVHSEINR